jgi:hypothetical protein
MATFRQNRRAIVADFEAFYPKLRTRLNQSPGGNVSPVATPGEASQRASATRPKPGDGQLARMNDRETE